MANNSGASAGGRGGNSNGLLPTPLMSPGYQNSQSNGSNSNKTIDTFSKSSVFHGSSLGQGGGFGNVIKGTLSSQHVAIKILHAPIGQRRYNVINVIIEGDPRLECPQLVYQAVNGGNLLDYLRQRRGPANELTLTKFGSDIVNGMDYLHEQNFIHGCLSARNILLDKFHEYTNAKISDYGMPRVIQGMGANYPIINANGSKTLPIRWMPKETLTSERTLGDLEKPADVWGFGVLFWEMWTDGERPYAAIVSNTDVKQHILNGSSPLTFSRPKKCPDGAITVMQNILTVNPKQRPTFVDLKRIFNAVLSSMQHPTGSTKAGSSNGADNQNGENGGNCGESSSSSSGGYKPNKQSHAMEFRNSERGAGARGHNPHSEESGGYKPNKPSQAIEFRNSERRGHHPYVERGGDPDGKRRRRRGDRGRGQRGSGGGDRIHRRGGGGGHEYSGGRGGEVRKTVYENRSQEKLSVPLDKPKDIPSVSVMPSNSSTTSANAAKKPDPPSKVANQHNEEIRKSLLDEYRRNNLKQKTLASSSKSSTHSEKSKSKSSGIQSGSGLKTDKRKVETSSRLQTTTTSRARSVASSTSRRSGDSESETDQASGLDFEVIERSPFGMAPPPYSPKPPDGHNIASIDGPRLMPLPSMIDSSPRKRDNDLERTVQDLQNKIAAMEVKQKVGEIEERVKTLQERERETRNQLFNLGVAPNASEQGWKHSQSSSSSGGYNKANSHSPPQHYSTSNYNKVAPKPEKESCIIA